jgi:hypothetical protein
MWYLLATVVFVAVFVAVEVSRLTGDSGLSFEEATSTVIEYAIYAVILAGLLALLAWLAFNANAFQAAMVFLTAAVNINHVGVALLRVRKSLAGSPHETSPSLTIGWDALLVTAFFAFAYLSMGLNRSNQLTLSFGDALYLSAVTITSTGYGDVTPPLAARPLAMLEPFLGYVLLGAWVVTLLQTAVSSKNRNGHT